MVCMSASLLQWKKSRCVVRHCRDLSPKDSIYNLQHLQNFWNPFTPVAGSCRVEELSSKTTWLDTWLLKEFHMWLCHCGIVSQLAWRGMWKKMFYKNVTSQSASSCISESFHLQDDFGTTYSTFSKFCQWLWLKIHNLHNFMSLEPICFCSVTPLN